MSALRVLVLGGTSFIGRHLVEEALRRGHDLTLFNRGLTNAALFRGVRTIAGDRNGDLGALRAAPGTWNAVVDTSGYLERAVARSAAALAERAASYVFVSSISAYASFAAPGLREDAPLRTDGGEGTDPSDPRTYGARKALCERAVLRSFPHTALIVRPGIVAGPYDTLGRFTYWVRRVAAGGRIVAPGSPDRAVQLIDVRDLTAWLLDLVEARAFGVYNATGPATPLTFAQMLDACRTPDGAPARFAWLDDAFLAPRAAQREIPFYAPGERARGFFAVDNAKALAAGLRLRPVRETAADTLRWLTGATAGEPSARVAVASLAGIGYSAVIEEDLLRAWDDRVGSGRVSA